MKAKIYFVIVFKYTVGAFLDVEAKWGNRVRKQISQIRASNCRRTYKLVY